MSLPLGIQDTDKGIREWAIISGFRGSIAHGMYVPSSDPNSIDDKDVMSVCVPPIDHYLGLRTYGSKGTKEVKKDEWDIVVYEAKKFVSLLAKGNPNVLMLLWLDDNYYMKITTAGWILIENRDAFVGRHVYKAFTGYAYGQLHRMTHGAKQGHMGEKRQELIEKYGYDTKNAAHLIRLLRMGKEFLKDGRLSVLRHDATQLLEIKKGLWTLDEVKKEADRGFEAAEKAYLESDLPAGVDLERVHSLCVDVVKRGLIEIHDKTIDI